MIKSVRDYSGTFKQQSGGRKQKNGMIHNLILGVVVNIALEDLAAKKS